jgi:hypothetical protein
LFRGTPTLYGEGKEWGETRSMIRMIRETLSFSSAACFSIWLTGNCKLPTVTPIFASSYPIL